MASEARVAGAITRDVTLNGVAYTLSQPDRVKKAADEERLLISLRQLPAGLTGQDRKDAIAAMTIGMASTEEWQAFYGSIWSDAAAFWRALDPKHRLDPDDPRGKRERSFVEGAKWCYELLKAEGVTYEERGELSREIDLVSQRTEVKNSCGLPTQGDTPATAGRSSAAQ